MIKKIKSNVTILNTVSSLLLQFVTILSGFVIPKIILKSFGSEVNGLVSSLNQFFGYASLIEGGLTGVVMASLYKPLVERNNEKISQILYTTEKFYNKLSVIFIIYALVLAILYPIIFKTPFSYLYVMFLALILGLGLLIQYNFSLARRTLLQADKKGYIVSFTQVLIIVINMVLFVIVSKLFPNIHILKLITALLFFLQPVIYSKVISKNFNICKVVSVDKGLMKNRWNGFSISFAAFIHNNTDVIVLTSLSTLKNVSIYSVYSLVTKGLSQIIKSVCSAIAPTIGQVYAKENSDELNQKFEFYEFIVFFISFLIFTVGFIMITPFVQLYTKGVNDANYYQPIFGYLLIMAELIFCLKEPHLNLAFSANKFKEMKFSSYLEAIINIVISVILVKYLGLIGVAIGTLIAMLYRMIYQVCYLRKNIINRRVVIFIKKFILFFIPSIITVLISLYLIPSSEFTIFTWILYSCFYTLIEFVLTYIMMLIFYKDNVKWLKKYIYK